MKTISDIIAIANSRLEEATILFENGKSDGAFYLAGYSVELMLKAKICEHYDLPGLFSEDQQDISNLPQGISELRKLVRTHNLHLLLIMSGLHPLYNKEKANNKALMNANSVLFNCWSEDVRYKPCGHKTDKDVEKLLSLLSGKDGILQWIQHN